MLKFYGIVILCDSVFLNNDSSTTLKRRPDEGQVFFFCQLRLGLICLLMWTSYVSVMTSCFETKQYEYNTNPTLVVIVRHCHSYTINTDYTGKNLRNLRSWNREKSQFTSYKYFISSHKWFYFSSLDVCVLYTEVQSIESTATAFYLSNLERSVTPN